MPPEKREKVAVMHKFQALDSYLRKGGYYTSDPANPKTPLFPESELGIHKKKNTRRRTPEEQEHLSFNDAANSSVAGATQRASRAAKRSAVVAENEQSDETAPKREKRCYTKKEIQNMTPAQRKKYDEDRAKNNAAVEKTRAKKEKEEKARRQREEEEKAQIELEKQHLSRREGLFRNTLMKLIERSVVIDKQNEGVRFNRNFLASVGQMNQDELNLYESLRAEAERRIMQIY